MLLRTVCHDYCYCPLLRVTAIAYHYYPFLLPIAIAYPYCLAGGLWGAQPHPHILSLNRRLVSVESWCIAGVISPTLTVCCVNK